MRFEPEEYVRIVVPDEVDPMGVVVLNEVSGRITATAGGGRTRTGGVGCLRTSPLITPPGAAVRPQLDSRILLLARDVPPAHPEIVTGSAVFGYGSDDDEVFDVANVTVGPAWSTRPKATRPSRSRRRRPWCATCSRVAERWRGDASDAFRARRAARPRRRPRRARGVRPRRGPLRAMSDSSTSSDGKGR